MARKEKTELIKEEKKNEIEKKLIENPEKKETEEKKSDGVERENVFFWYPKTKLGREVKDKKINKRKKEYVSITKKLRKYTAEMKKQKKISKEENKEIRKKIRNRTFKSKTHLKNYLGSLKNK